MGGGWASRVVRAIPRGPREEQGHMVADGVDYLKKELTNLVPGRFTIVAYHRISIPVRGRTPSHPYEYFLPTRASGQAPSSEMYSGWVLEFVIPGPDARYNSALTIFEPIRVRGLIATIQRGIDLLDSLRGQDFDGTYDRTVPVKRSHGDQLDLMLGATSRGSSAWFRAYSGTQYLRSRELSTERLLRLNHTLQKAPDLGSSMAASLARLREMNTQNSEGPEITQPG